MNYLQIKDGKDTDTPFYININWCSNIADWLEKKNEGGMKYQEISLKAVNGRVVLVERDTFDDIQLFEGDVKSWESVNVRDFVKDECAYGHCWYKINIPEKYNGRVCRIDCDRLVFEETSHETSVRFKNLYGAGFSIDDFNGIKFGYTLYPSGIIRSLVVYNENDDTFREFRSIKNLISETND